MPTATNPRRHRGGVQRLVIVPALLAFSLLLTTAGCNSTGLLERPEVTLVGLELIEMTVFETTLRAKLRISNPNPDPLAVEGAVFKLYLDGRKVGRGMTPDSFTVGRLDSQVTEVTFHVNNAAALLRLHEILEQEAVSYGVRASLFTQGYFGTRRLRIERQGRFDFQAAAALETSN